MPKYIVSIFYVFISFIQTVGLQSLTEPHKLVATHIIILWPMKGRFPRELNNLPKVKQLAN